MKHFFLQTPRSRFHLINLKRSTIIYRRKQIGDKKLGIRYQVSEKEKKGKTVEKKRNEFRWQLNRSGREAINDKVDSQLRLGIGS